MHTTNTGGDDTLHDVLRSDAVAELLGTSKYQVHRLAAKGVIPSWQVGAARRFSRRAILAWRDSGGTAAPNAA